MQQIMRGMVLYQKVGDRWGLLIIYKLQGHQTEFAHTGKTTQGRAQTRGVCKRIRKARKMTL
jgi:DNA-binding HxlR family transcriptional regulator